MSSLPEPSELAEGRTPKEQEYSGLRLVEGNPAVESSERDPKPHLAEIEEEKGDKDFVDKQNIKNRGHIIRESNPSEIVEPGTVNRLEDLPDDTLLKEELFGPANFEGKIYGFNKD